MNRRGFGRRGQPQPTSTDQGPNDQAILSFILLLAVLAAGFVTSLSHAEADPRLTSLFTILN